jgi:hypothetical protein
MILESYNVYELKIKKIKIYFIFIIISKSECYYQIVINNFPRSKTDIYDLQDYIYHKSNLDIEFIHIKDYLKNTYAK